MNFVQFFHILFRNFSSNTTHSHSSKYIDMIFRWETDEKKKQQQQPANVVKTNDDNEHNFSHKLVFYVFLMTEN